MTRGSISDGKRLTIGSMSSESGTEFSGKGLPWRLEMKPNGRVRSNESGIIKTPRREHAAPISWLAQSDSRKASLRRAC